MEALPTIGFALTIGLIVVMAAVRSKHNSRTAPRRDRGGLSWGTGDWGGASAGVDCADGGVGCGDGGD